ncbi:MAG TPA: diaminopimelate epimerase [Candidatus Cloacimonadota bacterium]|nr:diaminopimelate epimerase [Candidatus Cloacimonadota bacterium]
MQIEFLKMQAQGNDFIILEGLTEASRDLDFPALAQAVCQRRFGFGADGLVLILPSEEARARMVIYNSDGSRAEMCGSALRCLTQRLYDPKSSASFRIATDSGIKEVEMLEQNGALVPKVNLGKPVIKNLKLQVEQFTGSLVNIGNPHFVIFKDELQDNPHLLWGSLLEHHSTFEKSVNVHFAQVITPRQIVMKIWENAVGETFACGTGAASTVCAGRALGLLEDQVVVEMPGGTVQISCDSTGDYYLIGPVSFTGRGVYQWKV